MATFASSDSSALKIVTLGDSAVGKSKLIERFLQNGYQPIQMSTYAVTIYRHKAIIRDQKTGKPDEVLVEFWDTAGQERFSSMHPSYYHRAAAAILCFDVTRKQSYVSLQAWIAELLSYRKDIPIIVAANKIDVDYNVTKKSFAFPSKYPENCIPNVYFVSAADGTNVVKLFNDAIKLAVEYKAKDTDDIHEQIIRTLDYFEHKSVSAGMEDPTHSIPSLTAATTINER